MSLGQGGIKMDAKELIKLAEESKDKLCCVFHDGDDTAPCTHSIERLREIYNKHKKEE
jgi:peroxiredoxin